MLTVTVYFADDVAPAVERWADEYLDIDTARRWTEVMAQLYPVRLVDESRDCRRHGLEPLVLCGDCGFPTCPSAACDCGKDL